MSRIQFLHNYHHIISIENLLAAWKEFVKGKRARGDLLEFERNLMANIISLHRDLTAETYIHSTYQAFRIADPKPRIIHKANVRDRLLHRAFHQRLAPFFAKTFIADSYSCQTSKGTHRALCRLAKFINAVSRNDTRTAWALKGDIKKFFASVDHKILLSVIKKYIPSRDIIRLISAIVGSFDPTSSGIGLPLGNLTSQLFANIYMNEFDQFIKHRLKAKYYLRYADDFIVLSQNRAYLENILPATREFLKHRLKLDTRQDKISIKSIASGVDFLGWTHFTDHRVLRTTTKKRMFRNIKIKEGDAKTIQSYLGLVSYGNGWKLRQKIIDFALDRCV
jgi:retron-type reverse transcriptase